MKVIHIAKVKQPIERDTKRKRALVLMAKLSRLEIDRTLNEYADRINSIEKLRPGFTSSLYNTL